MILLMVCVLYQPFVLEVETDKDEIGTGSPYGTGDALSIYGGNLTKKADSIFGDL